MSSFLYLTTPEENEIIVGINSIALIRQNKEGKTYLTFNYSKGEKNISMTIYVKESIEEIRKMIE